MGLGNTKKWEKRFREEYMTECLSAQIQILVYMSKNNAPVKTLVTLNSGPHEQICGYCILISTGSWDSKGTHKLSGRNELPQAL